VAAVAQAVDEPDLPVAVVGAVGTVEEEERGYGAIVTPRLAADADGRVVYYRPQVRLPLPAPRPRQ